MLRLLLLLVIGTAVYAPAQTQHATPAASPAPVPALTLSGAVADPTHAIVPGARVLLLDSMGATAASATTDNAGHFEIKAPTPGSYTLSVSLTGFQTFQQPVRLGKTPPSPLNITLAIATVATQVTVNAATNTELADTSSNTDSVVMTADELRTLPVFDNDYVSAMSAFLDEGAAGTGGSGLMVDGMEANRVTVSPSAVQEVRINQDPYTARYYRPGRGQMEIITKPDTDTYHGEFNFFARDSALNAQNAFAPSKPPEQRRVYEGSVSGPLPFLKGTGFQFSANRAEEDLDAVVNATVLPTPSNPSGIFAANVPAPTRNTEFSMRAGHRFSDRNSAYALYSFQNSSNINQGVGNQTLPEAGVNAENREDDLRIHDDFAVSASTLAQFSLVFEHENYQQKDAQEAPKIRVLGNFSGGSAQSAQLATEYNIRAGANVYWTRGRHQFTFGANLPHLGRRVFEDQTNQLGTYTFSSLADYQNNRPSAFSAQSGQVRFLYHQQETGGYFQDQIKVTPRFSITAGLRYDWQNYLGDNKNNFSPRFSFALVLDNATKTVLRGGGGVYYDRFGSGPLLDLARYRTALRRAVQITLAQQSLCVPITDCVTLDALPPNLVEVAPGVGTPYQIHYGVSLERQVGERATLTFGVYSSRGVDLFRSIDLNAPLAPDYSARPDPSVARLRQIQAAGTQSGSTADVSFKGRYNKWFSAFGHYSWSHYSNNTGGIGFFPQDQSNPRDEWANADWDQRHRLGLYAMFHPESVWNLSAGIFASSGRPYTITTGADGFGDGLFNERPQGVPRNSAVGPGSANLDLRWNHDFRLRPSKSDLSPKLGFSAAAFNVLNHPNGSLVNSVQGSPTFGKVIAAKAPRRLQMAMRFSF